MGFKKKKTLHKRPSPEVVLEKGSEGEYVPRRPMQTAYESWMCDKIIEVAEQGGHVAQMCKEIGIKSKDTFYRWIKRYPEFGEAYETAKLHSQSFYENLLLAGACGKIQNYNFSSIAMLLNAKFGDEYKRQGGSHTEVNIDARSVVADMSTDELDKKIAALQERLNIEHKGDDDAEEKEEDA